VLDKNRKRARSEDEKEGRRAAILDAARNYVAESGFDVVTMSGLARRAGLAKGTLYLYFRTKEELFLSLFTDLIHAVVDRFVAEATPGTVAERLTVIAGETPLFLPLFARLVAVIEANVADEPLFAAKRAMRTESQRFASCLQHLLSCDTARAAEISSALFLAMQGAAQFDLTARRDPAGIPEDLRGYIASHAFGERFPEAARVILGERS